MSSQRDSVVPAERRRLILELLRQRGSLSVSAVEEQFGVSTMTARRDLNVLAEAGNAKRTHGGAMLPEHAAHEDAFQSRMERDTVAKTQLAKAVVAALQPEETVFIDASSSAYYVVRELLEVRTPITVLTNSLPVMTLIGNADDSRLELISLGGRFRPQIRSFVGAETARMIAGYSVDRVIFSVKAIEPDGSLTDPDPLEAEVKRAMIDRARVAVLVAEAHKFQQRGLKVIVPATRVDVAYLADPPRQGRQALAAAGVEIHAIDGRLGNSRLSLGDRES